MATTDSTIDCKLLLIGNSSVGKSSLFVQFFDKQWSPARASATVGVDFRVHNMEVKGKKVRLNIWDTAGAERFRALASSHYRGAQGVILVYDVSNRETFQALPRWCSELDTYAPESVVKIIVGNKVDKESSRQVSTSEGEIFARRMDSLFIETSAMTAVGVRETFEELVEKMLDTPELWVRDSTGGNGTGGNDDSVPGNVNIDSDGPQPRRGCAC